VQSDTTYRGLYTAKPLAVSATDTPFAVTLTDTDVTVHCTEPRVIYTTAASLALESNRSLTLSFGRFAFHFSHAQLQTLVKTRGYTEIDLELGLDTPSRVEFSLRFRTLQHKLVPTAEVGYTFLCGTDAAGNETIGFIKAADGSWQEIVMPLTMRAFRQLVPHIRANEAGNGWLEIAEVTFLGKDGKEFNYLNRNTCADDFIYYGKWDHSVPSPGRFIQTMDGVKICTDLPDGTYHGRYNSSIRAKLVKYHLKALGLGAICSDAHLPALTELNALGARLAAMARINAEKVIYGGDEELYGTIWQRDGKAAAAIYNDSPARRNLSLRLKRSAFADNGLALMDAGTVIRVFTDNGRPCTPSDITVTSDADWLYLTGPLEPGHLLTLENAGK
jgi:hypothetical protein